MATATELNINASASAMDMATEIFGNGVQVVSATFTGDPLSSGTYTGATTTIPGVVPSDSGVILSTGHVASFTNSSGTTNTNIAANTGTNTAGVDGNAQLFAVAGVATFDGAILDASFIPDGDYLTMQFVFTSEEYPEYVNQGVNDAFGVWVNGQFVPVSITVAGNVSIDTVNQGTNTNLYVDNTADAFNTEMDGFTYVLSLKAAVNAGQINTIRIGVADGGDSIFDSNLLIMGNSLQTYALAFDDEVQLTANSSRTFDLLANDTDLTDSGLTITQINGVTVVPGQTVTLATGEQVTLNANGTVTIVSDGSVGASNLTYTIVDGAGNTDTGFVTINTVAGLGPDGIVEGTASNDVIATGYAGDPDGDLIDANDALGAGGTTGDGDYILAGGGADQITSGAGADMIYAGADNDTVDGGIGNDTAWLGSGDDVFTAGAGADSVFGDQGDDAIATGADADIAYGGTGNDTLTGDAGADTLYGGGGADLLAGGTEADLMSGGDDADTFHGGAGDVVDGGEGGTDSDTLVATGVYSVAFDPTNSENGTITFVDNSTLTFTNIENLVLNGGNPDGTVWGENTGEVMDVGYVDNDGDIIDGEDAIFPGAAPNDDDIFGNGGADTITSGLGRDNVYGGDDADSITTGAGNDYAQGDAGNDTLYGGDDDDFLRGDAGNDSVFGGAGNDTVYGGLDEDIVDAGVGNDSAFGGFGNDFVYGGDGSDTITGSAGNDQVFGGIGDDTVEGAEGDDTLDGGAGQDVLNGLQDADVIYGGAGDFVDGGEGVTTGIDNDTLYVTDVASVTFDPFFPENGTVTFIGGGALSFINIENLYVDGVLVTTPNFVVDGTAGNDLIDSTYVDAQGDRIDAGDNATGTDADLVLAGQGNDTVLAGQGDDTVFGGGGADSILGNAGRDVISGEAGNDVVLAGADADSVSGGADNDDLSGEAGDDTLSGDAGLDTLSGGAGNDTLFGGTEDDRLSGGQDNDSLDGGDGVDTLEGGDGADTLQGGAGADTLLGDGGDDRFALTNGFGQDRITGGETAETAGDTLDLGGLTGAVRVDLTAADPEAGRITTPGNAAIFTEIETILLGSATETLVLADGSGADRVTGFGAPVDNGDGSYSGVDRLNVAGLTDAGGDPVTTADVVVSDDGSGNAVLTFPNGETLTLIGVAPAAVSAPAALVAMGIPVAPDLVVDGTFGDDVMDVGFTDIHGDIIDGADGLADTIYGYDGDDTITAGLAGDLVYAGQGSDVVAGGAGGDTLFGDNEADTLTGDTGDDVLDGGSGDDSLVGGEGADTLIGADGADTLDGGTEADSLAGGAGTDSLTGGDGADYADGGTEADTISGDAGNDTIYGDGGNDQLYGGGDDDSIGGGAGDDLLDGGAGADTLAGDGGNDTLQGLAGDDSLTGGDGNDSLFGWEDDDTLSGGADNDLVDGDAGDDSLSGDAGADTLIGDAGADRLDGGIGDDQLEGGTGADTLIGGDGADLIYGGNDRDVILGGGIGDAVYGGGGGDDFDTLDLRGMGKLTIDYNDANVEGGIVTFRDADGAPTGTMTFDNIENVIPCFTPGSLILTDRGEVPVEDLDVGDLVLTRDSGFQQIRWVGRRDLAQADLVANPRHTPVRIARGALGAGVPERDMLVSPQHRMLITGNRAELLFGEYEVLVAATHLVGSAGVSRVYPASISYLHLMFDRHEIIRADGAWSESFQPGVHTVKGLGGDQRAELLMLFPELAAGSGYPAARLALRSREARVLLQT